MKIAHIITEGRKRLVEGGNLSVNGQEAQSLDLKVTDRNFIVPVLNNLLLAINQGFKKQYKQDLWSPALLKSQEFLSGSSLHFFNVKGIPDETFVSKKPTVGDMDTMVDKTKEPQLQEFLTANQNKQIGPATLRGFKRGNEQFSSLWELQEPPIKIQIDFEFVAFEDEKPTDWARFSHSSSWEDLQAGVKGVFHKWLIQSLAALTRKDFYLRKMVGRGKARQEEDVPTTDNMYSFAVSSKEGGGLRPKYEPVMDAATGKPAMKDGLFVMTTSPTSGYEKNINKIFQSLLGQRISPEAAKSASQKFWSFTGLVDIVKELCTPKEKEQIVQAFLQKTIGPGSQGMYKNNPDKDIAEKTIAINYLLSALKMPKPANLDQMLKDYRTTNKTDADDDNTAKAKSNDVVKGMAKNALDEATAAPNYKRKGIQHIYNPGNSMEMKDAEFIDMCKEIASMGGKLDNAPINLKVDGAGIRFGKDEKGKPFFMTSKVTEPKYAENYGDFEKYGRSTGQDAERLNFTKNYDEALKTIVNADFMKDIPNDTIVQAEMLFTPMGKKEQGGLKFVNIPYDQKKLGTVMTLVPFSVKQYSTGETRPDQDKIKQALVKDSTKEIKMVNNQLQQNNVDVGAIVNPIAKNADKLLAAVKTRGDSEQKTKAHEILTQARKQLSDAIIKNPNIQGKDQLGKNIEGLVLNLPSGRLAKVTSQEMKDKMAAKQDANKKPTTGSNRHKTAVVTVGSFSGHKGHQQLIDQTINMANKLGGDPYIYVSPVVGPDDPIPANMKVATLQKLYPEYANNIQVWNSAGTPVKKIEKELVLPPNSPYNKIILIVGSDRYDGFKKWMDSLENRMKDPEAIKKYGGTQNQVDYETIKSERAAGKGGTGISFTMLRDILRDPNASEQDKLNLWSKAFDTDKLGINWIKKLMDTTAQNMQLKEFIDRIKPLLGEATSAQKEKFFAILSEVKTRLDPKCWKGYHKKGTKIKSGIRVNNCVPNESMAEGDVVQHKFQSMQDRKGKTPYYKNPDIEVPMYDPKLGRAWNQAYSGNNPLEPFDSFEVIPAGKTSAHIVGIKDGKKIKISTAPAELADVLTNAYNRGGFTDVSIQRVPLGEKNVTTKKKSNEAVAEGKVKLYTDPDYFGAEVDDAGFDSLPVVNISADRLVGFEPDSKMNQTKSQANVEKIVAGLKKGNKLPPLLVRKYKDGYQVLDGHHRFWAYKLLGVKSIPVQVVPAEDIEEITKQGVAEGWKDAAVGGVMALGALGAGSGHAAAQTMPNINAQQVELTKKYYDILVKRAIEDDMELDTRTKNRLMAKAQDAAQLKIQQNNQSQSNPQGAVEPPQNKPKPSITNFPSIGSERRVSKDAGQYEAQDRAESSKENVTENADYLEEK